MIAEAVYTALRWVGEHPFQTFYTLLVIGAIHHGIRLFPGKRWGVFYTHDIPMETPSSKVLPILVLKSLLSGDPSKRTQYDKSQKVIKPKHSPSSDKVPVPSLWIEDEDEEGLSDREEPRKSEDIRESDDATKCVPTPENWVLTPAEHGEPLLSTPHTLDNTPAAGMEVCEAGQNVRQDIGQARSAEQTCEPFKPARDTRCSLRLLRRSLYAALKGNGRADVFNRGEKRARLYPHVFASHP